MSEPQQEGQGPKKESKIDLRSLMHPRREGDKKSIVSHFLSSNLDNPTKSRIPSAPGMAVYQSLGLWASTHPKFVYDVKGEKNKEYSRSVEGLHQLFKDLFDEDAISQGGESRREAETVALGALLADAEDYATVRRDRLGEKGGAAKSK